MSVYGGSYYGLLAYADTDGVVHDASAIISAVSSIASVNHITAIGADASTTVASASSCSGEVVIIEETDKFSYGSGLYGQNPYDNTDLQTIVSVTSSTSSVTPLVYRQIPVTISASLTINALGGMRYKGEGTTTSSSTVSSSGVRYRESSATVNANSTTTVSPTATYSDSVSIAVTCTVSANAEKFFLESSDKFAYGTGLYGINAYDEADLQTIVSATSVSSTASGEKINLNSAIATSTSTSTLSAEKIHRSGGAMTSTAVGVAHSVFVASSGGLMLSTSGTTIAFIRKRNTNALVSSTSGTLTIAREKWEVVSPTGATWSTISETSQTWTKIAA